MVEERSTGYDGLSSRLVPENELRAFLLDCFEVGEPELFIAHVDRVDEALGDVPKEVVYAAFCTYSQASGHFAMSFEVGLEGRLAGRVGRREFIRRFAARFDAYVLYGDDGDPLGLWTVILPDGDRLLAGTDEEDDGTVIYTATAPIPGLPGIRVDESLR